MRVRVIFELPAHIGLATPLVYVEFFTPFHARPAADVGLLSTSRSVSQQRPRSGVIPLDRLLRSCHLLPIFPSIQDGGVPADWTSANVLDKCPRFLLNEFLNDDMYGRSQANST